jgi:prolyl oligopeptidase
MISFRFVPTIAIVGIATVVAGFSCAAQNLQYPATKKVDVVDTYFGLQVADPYRWLEDETSPERTAWIDAQNAVTFGFLERIPFRKQLQQRLEQSYNYPKYSAPFRKGEYFFYYKNDGLQNQSVLYVQKGLDGTPEVLLDPNSFSTDGTTRLTAFAVSKDLRWAAYGISRGGSDWQEFITMDFRNRTTLPDTLKWVKVSGLAWQGSGFYYSRYPAPESGKELTTKNENHIVYYHTVGTPQSTDRIVYSYGANPQRFHIVSTTEDERFAVLNVSERGTGKKGNALFVMDVARGDTVFRPLVATITDDQYGVMDNVGDKFLVVTNRSAPNSRVVMIDPAMPDELNWTDVIPEKPEPLQSATVSGEKIFARYLKDVATKVFVHALDGMFENEVVLPTLGTASGFGGERDERFVFYTFTSFTFPPTIFRYDIATRTSTVFRSPEIPEFDPAHYETKQVFVTSKDGTRVPMFLTYKKGIALNGSNPTLLYAYGGFNVTTAPNFSSLRLALLEQGFVYASANIRGGGEYGERWHEAGTKTKKQNVFDDFIACAEWLIAKRYTSSKKLAIQGGSNGGLLVGAVLNQRPELFGAAIPQVGVMDMLRFHKFTIGWNWIPDYGSSEAREEEFKALYAYSPYHNIRATSYPPTLITTADHDDRVVPAHSLKYAARLQEMQQGDAPVLIRVETKSGHGSVSTTKQIEEVADIYSFLMHTLGVEPKLTSR